MTKLLIEDVKIGTKYLVQVKQRDYLQDCIRRKLCPPEIRSLASRINSNRTKKPNYEIEHYIMTTRIRNINFDMRKTIRYWNKATNKVNYLDLPRESKNEQKK